MFWSRVNRSLPSVGGPGLQLCTMVQTPPGNTVVLPLHCSGLDLQVRVFSDGWADRGGGVRARLCLCFENSVENLGQGLF